MSISSAPTTSKFVGRLQNICCAVAPARRHACGLREQLARAHRNTGTVYGAPAVEFRDGCVAFGQAGGRLRRALRTQHRAVAWSNPVARRTPAATTEIVRAQGFAVVAADIPEDLTIADYRIARHLTRKQRRGRGCFRALRRQLRDRRSPPVPLTSLEADR
jgi:hypothetical protein